MRGLLFRLLISMRPPFHENNGIRVWNAGYIFPGYPFTYVESGNGEVIFSPSFLLPEIRFSISKKISFIKHQNFLTGLQRFPSIGGTPSTSPGWHPPLPKTGGTPTPDQFFKSMIPPPPSCSSEVGVPPIPAFPKPVLRVELSSEGIFCRPMAWGGRGLFSCKGVPPAPKNERYPYPPTNFLKT